MPADLLAFGLAVALAAEPAAPADEPPMALIEFLGLWITDDGHWIDPEVLDALPEPPPDAATGQDAPAAPAGRDAPVGPPKAPKESHPEAGGAGDGAEPDHE